MVMGDKEVMGYQPDFGCNRLGNSKNLWERRNYGWKGLWDRRTSTVLRTSNAVYCPISINSAVTRHRHSGFGRNLSTVPRHTAFGRHFNQFCCHTSRVTLAEICSLTSPLPRHTVFGHSWKIVENHRKVQFCVLGNVIYIQLIKFTIRIMVWWNIECCRHSGEIFQHVWRCVRVWKCDSVSRQDLRITVCIFD